MFARADPTLRSGATRSPSLGLLILAVLLFAYAGIRAYLLPITWDEAANYLVYTRKGMLSPFYFQFPHFGANNHFLNSWLTYLTTMMMGTSEFSLRVPVLAAYLLYLYYTARLSSEWPTPLLRLSSFVVLNANPYLLDFFSLSRGYGLAYGLLAGSLWYLYLFFKTGRESRFGLASVAFATLAVTAFIATVHVLIALLAVLLLSTFLGTPSGLPLRFRISGTLKVHAVAIAGVSLFLFPTLVVLRRLRRAGAFFYGGDSGLWKDTIVSVFDRSLYYRQPPEWFQSGIGAPWSGPGYLLGSMAVLAYVIALGISWRGLTRQMEPTRRFLTALVLLLAWCAAVLLVQHHALGVLYLTGRTALYLLVLFLFLLVGLANELHRLGRGAQYGLAVIALLAAVHTIRCLNLTYVLEWKPAADVKSMIEDIAALRRPGPNEKGLTDVGVDLNFEAPINFYRAVAHLTWLNIADRKVKFHPLNDFYLYRDDDWQALNPDSFEVLKTYPLSHGRLLRRRIQPSYQVSPLKIVEGATPSPRLMYRIGVAPAVNSSVVTVTARIWMESLGDANAELVVEFKNSNGPYSWHAAAVRDFGSRDRTWFPFSLSCFVPTRAQAGDQVSVYLSNAKSPVYVADLQLRWLTAVY